MGKAKMYFGLLLLLSMCLPQMAHAGYTEKLTVQVFDQSLRPVQGALVYVQYQLNSVTGNTKTLPRPTNSSGYITIVFTDYEQITASTDYTYTIYVKYGDQLANYGMTAIDGESRIVTGSVDSYYLFVRSHDQKGKPVASDVRVSGKAIDTQDKMSTPSGDAFFQLPPGNYSLRAEYNGVVKTKGLLLSADQAADISFGSYSLDITVTDDSNHPLVASVVAGTQSVQTGADGRAHLENITDSHPSVAVKYADRYKAYTPDLSISPDLTAVFDLTKPAITDLHSTLSENGEAAITFFVEDRGSAASGVDTVSVSYDIEGVETPVQAYTIGYGTYEAKVPAQPSGTLVKYSVRITDKDGNAALGSGSYIVPGASAAPSPAPTPTPSPIPSVPATANGIPTELLALLGVVALLIIYAIYYYLKRRKEEIPLAKPPSLPSSEKPPVQPPA